MDQRDGFIRDIQASRDVIAAFFDLLVSGCGIFRLKRRHSEVKSVKNDSNAPNIDLKMIPLAFQHFRRNIIRRATHSSLAFPLELQLSSQSKVSNLDIELRIDEDVS